MSLRPLPRRAFICAPCLARLSGPLRPTPPHAATNRHKSTQPPAPDDYYALLLAHPLAAPTPSTRPRTPAPAPAPAPPRSAAPRPLTPRKPRPDAFGFASPLVPPASRPRSGGSALGERPLAPDNCCMGGCVHCVWDVYREDLEMWLQVRRAREGAAEGPAELNAGEGRSGEGAGQWGSGGLFGDVPVGIREFMRLEKTLKEKRKAP